MPWMHLATNSRTAIPATETPTGDVGITAPVLVGAGLPNLGAIPNPTGVGLIRNTTTANGDTTQVGFITTDGNPGTGNANVYRVMARRMGRLLEGILLLFSEVSALWRG